MSIYLVGIGMGTEPTLTLEAKQAIEKSDVIIGASRMLSLAAEHNLPYGESAVINGKLMLNEYVSDKIYAFLKGIKYKNASVLLSGDVGFYSGAKKLADILGDDAILIAGVSTLQYFCAKLKISWQDVCTASLHGRSENVIQKINRNRYTFVILDSKDSLHDLCSKLMYYDMNDVIVTLGEDLGYESENIISHKPEKMIDIKPSKLASAVIENPCFDNRACISIPDDEFIRDSVPMTKSAVRSLSISKLRLESDSVVYDVGGGTGSVSVEIALQHPDIKVYSIEKNPKACELISLNKKKFKADNVDIIEGTAPDVLESLPKPDRVFIGGSSGNMKAVIDFVFSKNPKCRIVVNTVTLNSLNDIYKIIDDNDDYDADFTSVQIAESKRVGKYFMMNGQNPVYIISITKRG